MAKPRIKVAYRKFDSYAWQCHCAAHGGEPVMGYSPTDAYNAWVKRRKYWLYTHGRLTKEELYAFMDP